jgi:sialate O-acetylesterase
MINYNISQKLKKHTFLLLLFISILKLQAQVTVSSVFSDNMVLQQEKKLPIWGTASVGEKITVKFSNQTKKTSTDLEGNWKIYLDPLKLSTKEQTLEVSGNTTKVFKNILVGDVWLVSGQSNMQRNIKSMGSINADILKSVNNPLIRILNVPRKVSTAKLNSMNANWQVPNKKAVEEFSAIGFIFAEKLQTNLNIPIGVINVSVGSTSVMCWLPKEVVVKDPFYESYKYWGDLENNWEFEGYKPFLKKAQNKFDKTQKGKKPTKENLLHITESRTYPAGVYNAMLHPIIPFAIKGILWRQGEANASRAVQYEILLPKMIDFWRVSFKDKTLPFIEIGLPSYGNVGKQNYEVAELRVAQQKIAVNDKNTYYIPLLDLIDLENRKATIHPHNKYLAGERSANVVLQKIYNKNINTDAPIYDSMEVFKNKIVLTFKLTGSGFFTGKLKDLKGEEIEKTNENPTNFWIAGADKKFVKATAILKNGNQIEVFNNSIKNPKAVRYGWSGILVDVNLYGSNGFPLDTFRTDNWSLTTQNNVKPKINIIKP